MREGRSSLHHREIMLCGFVRHTVEQYIIISNATMTFIKTSQKNEVIIRLALWGFVPQTVHSVFFLFLFLSLLLYKKKLPSFCSFSKPPLFLSTVVRSLQQQ